MIHNGSNISSFYSFDAKKVSVQFLRQLHSVNVTLGVGVDDQVKNCKNELSESLPSFSCYSRRN